MFPPPSLQYPPVMSGSIPPTAVSGSEPSVFWPSLFPAPSLVIPRTPFTTYLPSRAATRVESEQSVTTVIENHGAESQRNRGLSDQTDAKTEASKPPTTSSVAEPATETEAKRINAAVINGRRTSAVPSMKPGCKEVAPERMSKMNQEVEDNAVNELNSELKELLQEARLSEERYNCIKLEIDTLRDLNRSRSGLIAEAKRLVHSLREELLDKEISLRQLQNEKEQLELDLRLVDDDARFFEEELTRLQTRVERAQAEADATFIREEMANLEAGGGDEDDDEYGDASEEEDEDDDEDENEDKDKEEDNDDDDDDEYDECEENSSEEEEIDNYECDEDNSSSDLAGNSGIAARKNLEQFLEMMMELEQLKLEAQAADELNQLAEALEKDESVRLNVFEKKLKHHNERHNENDGTKDNDPVQAKVI